MSFGAPVLVALRILLVGVFGLAGIMKLLDQAGSRKAFVDFGGPRSLARASAIVLPLLELAIALALIAPGTSSYGAGGALALLLTFMGGIGVSLARGRAPTCHCFGQLAQKPVTWRTLARNGLLASAAGAILLSGQVDAGPSLGAWLLHLTALQRVVVLGGAFPLAVLGVRRLTLIRAARQKKLADKASLLDATVATARADSAAASRALFMHGHPVGTPAPDFALENLHGRTVTLQTLRAADKPIFLLFSDPDCGPCHALLPEVATWEEIYRDALTFVVLSRGTPAVNRIRLGGRPPTHVLLQAKREVADAYAALGTPSAVVVRADGTIGSPVAKAKRQIKQLVDDWTRSEVSRERSDLTGASDAARQAHKGRATWGEHLTPAVTAALDPDAKPVKHDCVEDELLSDGSIVLYNACKRQVVTLNATGALVWECCDGEHGVDAIAAEVRDVFPEAASADQDVRDVLDKLLQKSMIASAVSPGNSSSSPAPNA